jgi:DNA (cytosine-5)-methyltransferase 1
MKGFTSAYKRMNWDNPASAITRNFPYACSDNKIHPEQNRTLSVLEALALHSIGETEYKFEYKNGKKAGSVAIRDTLGESVPPKFLEILFDHILKTEN